MTPSDIEVLLHCHFMPGPHPRRNAPAVDRALKRFFRAGIIELSIFGEEHSFGTTERGAAWVKAITQVPYPETW